MRALFVLGTRPEAIKLAPLIKVLEADPRFEAKVAVTGQHREMADQVLAFFGIRPDFDLDLMTHRQTLSSLTARALAGLTDVVEQSRPDIVLVQGDTTTAFTGALAAFYAQTPIAHIEAGLRTGQRYSPFPEEANRSLIGRLASYHFAPTTLAAANLQAEGVTEDVWVVGNTAIDALMHGLEIVASSDHAKLLGRLGFVDTSRRSVLITNHRRESFGKPFRDICSALRRLAEHYPDVQFVYPVHLNPNVREPVEQILAGISNVHLLEPLDYPEMIWLMSKCHLVITDSGGIQEEAPSLGKPVLVTREVTERQEGVEAGTCRLVGSDAERIFAEAARLLDDETAYLAMSGCKNPYGHGDTSIQVRDILLRRLG